LPLAIPVFVRARDENGKEFLEFATALNVSAGGALVAIQRSLPSSQRISLEIPSAHSATLAGLPKATRRLPSKLVYVQPGTQYNLVGFRFSRPLLRSVKTER
jgi:hypothetical protein